MTQVADLAKIVAAPGKRDELLATLARMVEQAKTEDGTLVYIFHAAVDDDVTVYTYELYTDQAARDAHGASEAFKEIGPALRELLGGAPELIKLSPYAGKGL